MLYVVKMCRDSSVNTATHHGLDGRGSISGMGRFSFSPQRLQPHSASYTMGTVALSLGIKRPEREANHSLAPIVEVKNVVDKSSVPLRLYGVMLN
jgi:hypothetical protein